MDTPPDQPRRRLRPTRALAILGLILAAMAVAAANYQSNGAWLVLFLTLSLIAVSAVWTWRNLTGAALVLGEPLPVAAGLPVDLPAGLTGDRPRWGVVAGLAEDPDPRPLDRHLHLPPQARGVHRISRLRLRSRWPFGLFEAEVLVPVALTVIAYPPPQGASWGGGRGGGSGGEAQDFAGLRPWQTGDRPRHIDWRAAARREDQAPPVKTYAGDGQGDACWLAWTDTVEAEPELRLGQLSRWVLDLHQEGRRFGLRLPGVEILPGVGPVHQRACLAALAGWRVP